MKRAKNRRRNKSNFSFERLENRQVLTAVFLGTNQVDTASIEYAGEHLVNIQINDVLHENVDSSEGIRLNLGESFGGLVKCRSDARINWIKARSIGRAYLLL